MKKSCTNCYWQITCKRDKENKGCCDKHNFECSCCGIDYAVYRIENKLYCGDCVLDKSKVEKEEVTNYYLEGEYVGSDEDKDAVISKLDGVSKL